MTTNKERKGDSILSDLSEPFDFDKEEPKGGFPVGDMTAFAWLHHQYDRVRFMERILADQASGNLSAAGQEVYADHREAFPTLFAVECAARGFWEYSIVDYKEVIYYLHYTYTRIEQWDEQLHEGSHEMHDRVVETERRRLRTWDLNSLAVDDGDPLIDENNPSDQRKYFVTFGSADG